MKKQNIFRNMLLSAFTAVYLLTACSGEQSSNGVQEQQEEAMGGGMSETTPETGIDAEVLAAMNYENQLQAYFGLKDALVASSAVAASAIAEKLAGLSEGEVSTAASSLAAAADIEEQRKHFQTLSESLYAQLKEGGASQTVYKQYCPMAFNNQGAFWLSSEEQILNPYFGDMMLKCGRVEETLSMQ